MPLWQRLLQRDPWSRWETQFSFCCEHASWRQIFCDHQQIFHFPNKSLKGSANRDEKGRAVDFLGKQFRYKCQVDKKNARFLLFVTIVNCRWRVAQRRLNARTNAGRQGTENQLMGQFQQCHSFTFILELFRSYSMNRQGAARIARTAWDSRSLPSTLAPSTTPLGWPWRGGQRSNLIHFASFSSFNNWSNFQLEGGQCYEQFSTKWKAVEWLPPSKHPSISSPCRNSLFTQSTNKKICNVGIHFHFLTFSTSSLY